MKSTLPLVTVLMPIFNVEKYLDEAISSILGQTFKDFEFLIINDGSGDKSADIVRKYEDKRIRFIDNKKHQGLVAVLNQGLSLARGQYLARMDGDDISLPTRLERQVKFMDKHHEIDICGTWFEVFEPDGRRKIYTRPTNPAACKATLLFTDPVCHASVIMRMALIRKYHLAYDPEFRHLEDYEFFNRVSAYMNFGNVGEVLYLYRYHHKRTGSVYKKQQEYQMRRVIKIYLKKLGIVSPAKYISLHWQILTRSYERSRAFVAKARSWLFKLIVTNDRSLIYDPVEFRREINKRLAIVERDCRPPGIFSSRRSWRYALRSVRSLRAWFTRQFQTDERNTIRFQKNYWVNAVMKNYDDHLKLEGYGWGNPEQSNTNDEMGVSLGNYLFVKQNYLLPNVKDAVVLEIGSGGGKWTQYMRLARKIICVDLTSEVLDYVKDKLNWRKLRYYKTLGSELAGVKSSSVDFIFSMDSLVRIPLSSLAEYFSEMSRVLKNGGKLCLHLPCKDKAGSVLRNFVPLSTEGIKTYCRNNGLGIITIDDKSLTHGVVLLARKEKKIAP